MSEKRLVLASVFGRLTQVDSHVDPQWAMSVHKTWKDTKSVYLNWYTPVLIPTQTPTHPHEHTGPHYNDQNRGTEQIRHINSLFTVSQVKDKNSPTEWLNNMKRNSGRTVELISIALKNEERSERTVSSFRNPPTTNSHCWAFTLAFSHFDSTLSYRTSKKCKGQRSSFSSLEGKKTNKKKNKETVITTTKLKIYIHTKNWVRLYFGTVVFWSASSKISWWSLHQDRQNNWTQRYN